MKTGEYKDSAPVMVTVFPFISMLAAMLPSAFNDTSGINTVKIGITTLLLTGAVAFYIRENADGILNKKNAMLIITVTYLCSICLLLFIPHPDIFSFWMVCGLLISMLVDNKLGLLLHFNLSFLMGISFTMKPEQVIQVLIMGVLMSMLSGAMKKKSTVIYASIIILSTNMTIAFAFNNFIFDTKTNYNYFKSLFSIIAVLVTAYFVYALYNRFVFGEGEEEELIEKYSPDDVQNTSTGLLHASSLTASTVAEEVAATNSNQEVEADILSDASEDLAYVSGTSYEVLCDLENTLLKQLKEYSVSIYEHSLSIGELSKRAAGEIGANEMLALAGGLYHEIGKLKGKNYIEEGLNLAEEYAFPKELKQIIKQHNIKYDKPGSVEAAIVMMSDSVVSTIDYIKNSDEKKFSTNKIIENIFQLRMEKGTFDACSLSLKDYKKLKEFFQNEFGDELKKS